MQGSNLLSNCPVCERKLQKIIKKGIYQNILIPARQNQGFLSFKVYSMKGYLIKIAALGMAGCLVITGCSLRKNGDAETSDTKRTVESTQGAAENNDDYYDETDAVNPEGSERQEETDLGDVSVTNTIKGNPGLYYRVGDSVPVLYSVDGMVYNATAVIESFETGDLAEAKVLAFNSNSKDTVIDELNEEYEYGELTYTLTLLDSGVVAPISSQLDCRVVGLDSNGSSALNFNGAEYQTGSIYYVESSDIASGDTTRNTAIFCIPRGCTEFGLSLGNSIISYN